MLAHSVTETNNSLKTDKVLLQFLHSVHIGITALIHCMLCRDCIHIFVVFSQHFLNCTVQKFMHGELYNIFTSYLRKAYLEDIL